MSDQTQALKAEIVQLANDWMGALIRHDMPALERFLGEEFALQAPDLGRMDRARWLQTSPNYNIDSLKYDNIQVHLYGDVAVMQSRAISKAMFQGQDRSREFLLTDVWVKRDGRWQVVARHSSY